ncbi:hypothetical protein [Rubrobacter aplysinae]|uniref:hypothetical protein n=1 Tax=Rubrobacter aplysinae TaxID=909625 RepID=UPI00064BEE6C|nr:hypothetical protein [Rubrobacter aplysinae]
MPEWPVIQGSEAFVVAHGRLEEFTESLLEQGLSKGDGHEEAGRLTAQELSRLPLPTGYGRPRRAGARLAGRTETFGSPGDAPV